MSDTAERIAERGVTLSLVVAMDRGRAIGRDGALPWHLPDDLKRFRAITMGKAIVMGRRTHESIGRALPGRRNIVLTRDAGYRAPGCEVHRSLVSALDAVDPGTEVMIIGGAALYQEALPLAARIYLTEIDAEVGGDVHFPELDRGAWREVSAERHGSDERHLQPYVFRVLERAGPRPRYS